MIIKKQSDAIAFYMLTKQFQKVVSKIEQAHDKSLSFSTCKTTLKNTFTYYQNEKEILLDKMYQILHIAAQETDEKTRATLIRLEKEASPELKVDSRHERSTKLKETDESSTPEKLTGIEETPELRGKFSIDKTPKWIGKLIPNKPDGETST